MFHVLNSKRQYALQLLKQDISTFWDDTLNKVYHLMKTLTKEELYIYVCVFRQTDRQTDRRTIERIEND